MSGIKRQYKHFKEEGKKARYLGYRSYECPHGLTATERAFWSLGFEAADEEIRQKGQP